MGKNASGDKKPPKRPKTGSVTNICTGNASVGVQAGNVVIQGVNAPKAGDE